MFCEDCLKIKKLLLIQPILSFACGKFKGYIRRSRMDKG
jgi:hypothetical protein